MHLVFGISKNEIVDMCIDIEQDILETFTDISDAEAIDCIKEELRETMMFDSLDEKIAEILGEKEHFLAEQAVLEIIDEL